MQPAKTILTVLLLAAFSFPLMLPVFLQVQQQYAKWEMNEKLELKETITVQLKKTDIHWIKLNKECFIADEMFDVKKIERHSDILILTGLFDKKEKAIKKQLEDIANGDQKPFNKQKLKPFSLLLFISDCIYANNSGHIKSKTESLHKQIFYLQPIAGNSTPPPRLS